MPIYTILREEMFVFKGPRWRMMIDILLWCEICCKSNNRPLRKTNVWFRCSRIGEFKHKYKANGILKYKLIEIRLLRFHQVISLVYVKPKCFSLPSNVASVFHHSMKSRRKDNDKKHSDFNMYMTLTLILGLPIFSSHDYMGRVKRIWYLSPMRAAKVQNLRCSLIQAVSQEEPSDREPDPWPLWMAGHAQLQFVMTECSKTQIRLTRPIWRHSVCHREMSCKSNVCLSQTIAFCLRLVNNIKVNLIKVWPSHFDWIWLGNFGNVSPFWGTWSKFDRNESYMYLFIVNIWRTWMEIRQLESTDKINAGQCEQIHELLAGNFEESAKEACRTTL